MGATAGAIRAGRAFVELFTDDSKLVQGLRQGEAKLKAWGAAVSSAGSKLFALGASVVTPLAVSAKMFADMGSELNDMSSRTGASVEALSTLGFAAKQSGTDMEGLETSLRKMQKNIEAAATGSQEAQHALARLGLTANDLKGMKPEDQFRVLGDVISQIANPTERAAAAMAIFGKSGTQLLPMFEGGIAGLTAMEERARALGLEMSGKDAAAADSLGDALDALWDTVKMGVFSVGSALAPMLEGLIETTTAIVVSASNWVKENR